ncbi:hypothetical protein C8Q73DRAFT_677221 [Cubamyces lactineus]|nr:hypothetical protein C8Q73DRAFT_677221 [Cubamyces lactineus]
MGNLFSNHHPGQPSNNHTTSPHSESSHPGPSSTTSNSSTIITSQTPVAPPPTASSPSTGSTTSTESDSAPNQTSTPSESSSCATCFPESSSIASQTTATSVVTSFPVPNTSTDIGANATDTTISTTSSRLQSDSATVPEMTPPLGTPASSDSLTPSTAPLPPAFSGHSPASTRGNDGGASGKSHTGAIVGGVIGGLALVLFVAFATILLRRRRRARHTAPSAEFLDIMRQGGGLGQGGALSPVKQDGRPTTPGLHYYSDEAEMIGGDGLTNQDWTHPLARQSSLESDERPPAFTPGAFRDPVLEKARTAAAMREHYLRRESLSTVAGAGAARVVDGSGAESGHGWHVRAGSTEAAGHVWAM